MTETTERANIMVVDDHAANLKILQEVLQIKGYRVLAASDGKTALKAAARNPPDLILLDIIMPEMDGFEVCKRMKADAALREIPVIFISALAETEDLVKAFAVGGVDYVTKPFRFEEV
ncbi:MAG: response regulator, partial [Syntrophales bacterium]